MYMKSLLCTDTETTGIYTTGTTFRPDGPLRISPDRADSWRQTGGPVAGVADRAVPGGGCRRRTGLVHDQAKGAGQGTGAGKTRPESPRWPARGPLPEPVAQGLAGGAVPQGHAHRGLRLLLPNRSEEHTSELQSLMRISYAVF